MYIEQWAYSEGQRAAFASLKRETSAFGQSVSDDMPQLGGGLEENGCNVQETVEALATDKLQDGMRSPSQLAKALRAVAQGMGKFDQLNRQASIVSQQADALDKVNDMLTDIASSLKDAGFNA